MNEKPLLPDSLQIPNQDAILVAMLAIGLIAGCGKGSTQSVAGLQNFNMSVTPGGNISVAFVADTINITAGAEVPIPGIANSEIGMVPNLQSPGGAVFTFSVPLASLLPKGISGQTTEGLPDGRAIPDIASGTLPEWTVPIGNVNVSVYLDNQTFGFFVPMGFLQSLPTMLTQDIDDSNGNLIGKVYAIPAAGSGTQSGLLVIVPYVSGQSS